MMSCIGVLFAINSAQEKQLKALKKTNEIVDYVKEHIEDQCEENDLCDVGEAWDAIHRCFADGRMKINGGEKPLNSIIFGGEMVISKGDYLVSFKDSKLVNEIATKITDVTQDELRERYDKIARDYQIEKTDEDFDYNLEYFESLREFYIKMAKTNRSIIFTVDQ